jgi:hypothetical protein
VALHHRAFLGRRDLLLLLLLQQLRRRRRRWCLKVKAQVHYK